MAKIPQRTRGSALERGRFIRRYSRPQDLAHHPENRELVADMYRRYRFEWVMELAKDPKTGKWLPSKPTDEWIVVGLKGQCFEAGPGRLGFTIQGSKWVPMVKRATEGFATVDQDGDGEANLSCPWTVDNVEKLAGLLSLRKRLSNPMLGVSLNIPLRGLKALAAPISRRTPQDGLKSKYGPVRPQKRSVSRNGDPAVSAFRFPLSALAFGLGVRA